MANAPHYKSNLRDIFFNLFEMYDVGTKTLGHGPYAHLDEETMRGGIGAPPSVCWAVNEMIVGANPPVAFYTFGTFIARIIDGLGSESQKKRFVQPAIDQNWGGTMQLSEPQAGSDVGEARCKATHVEGDRWHLNGTKCWITNGDFDAVDNILHLVLARPEGGKPGTKGLSLFIVPKFMVNDDGSLGDRNGVFATSIEHKMGIKASSTCVMEFGADTPAVGYLVGEVHDGIATYGSTTQDQVELAGGHRAEGGGSKNLDKLNDLLLPLIKGYSSERVYDLLNTSLQVFGGAGYTQDWPIEQYIRDQKIDSLYEGTTHIQALDLIFRKIARDNGETLMGLAGEIQATVDSADGGDALKGEKEALGKALLQLQGILGVMLPRMAESLYHVGLHANRVLSSLAEVVIGWLLVRQAIVALKKLPTANAADKDFYEGKLAIVKFYTREILPNIALHKKVIEGSDLSLMDVAESQF